MLVSKRRLFSLTLVAAFLVGPTLATFLPLFKYQLPYRSQQARVSTASFSVSQRASLFPSIFKSKLLKAPTVFSIQYGKYAKPNKLLSGGGSTGLETVSPANGTEQHCQLKLYSDIMENRRRDNRNFDALITLRSDDRLIFLVPLLIINWYHRHPHESFPYEELDGLLIDMSKRSNVSVATERWALDQMKLKTVENGGHCLPAHLYEQQEGNGKQQVKNLAPKDETNIQLMKFWLGDSSSPCASNNPLMSADCSQQSVNETISQWFDAIKIKDHVISGPPRLSMMSDNRLDSQTFMTTTSYPL